MTQDISLSRETFLHVAEDSGLDLDAAHLEDLYAYLHGLLPTLKSIENLDLTDIEPFMPSLAKKG
ncbi:MAG TPA: hypothetical protein VLK23_02225 [Thermodesulfobacteriota bacterium]|nr:hypothetical protein [Thermodesulfobacteriota bacterium]